MTDVAKSLFTPIVEPNEIHPSFQTMLNHSADHPARLILDYVYQDFHDPDHNFLQQFQTDGFDARFFELYLFAYFTGSGFHVDRSHRSPDFLVHREGTTVAVEATTVGPSQGEYSVRNSVPLDRSSEEYEHYLHNDLPIKFGGAVFSKFQRKYWELEHCKELPLVIAVEAFFNEMSLSFTDSALSEYLYGLRDSGKWDGGGSLEIHSEEVDSHVSQERVIPSNFFGLPGAENISAVLFTNSGTHGKFTRMGFQQGFGRNHYDVSVSGLVFTPDPDSMDPTYFEYNMSDPLIEETWGQGMVVYHNPKALYPVPKSFFAEALQGYLEDGKVNADVPFWHPYTSITRSLHFNSPASRPATQPGLYVTSISRAKFRELCPFAQDNSNPLFTEEGWFIDDEVSFLGVVVKHRSDQTWGYVILARDKNGIFRAIVTEAGGPTRDETRLQLQMAIASLVKGE